MEAKKILKILLIIGSIITGLVILESVSPAPHGLIVGAAELAAEVLAIYTIANRPQLFESLPKKAKLGLYGFFGSLFIADSSYITLFYGMGISNEKWWTVLLTAFFYATAFFCAATAFISSFRSGIKSMFTPMVLVPAIVFIPVALKFIILPFLEVAKTANLSLYLIAQGMTVVATLAALLASMVAIISSRSLSWSVVALGVLALVFSDWALRVEQFHRVAPQFGFYEFFWATGVFISTAGIYGSSLPLDTIERFSFRSLLASYKLATLILALVSLCFLSLSQFGSLAAIKIVSLGCSLGITVSVLASHFLAERVLTFTEQLATTLADGDQSTFEQNNYREQHVPIELEETFRIVFQQRVRDRRLQEARTMEMRLAQERSAIAEQVAHDIRAPLAALNALSKDMHGMPEDGRELARSAVRRIRAIADGLLTQYKTQRTEPENSTTQFDEDSSVCQILKGLIAEKVSQHRGHSLLTLEVEASSELHSTVADITKVAFERAISNILDNAIEAAGPAGKVRCILNATDAYIILDIKDNGLGIPLELLHRIGIQGFSHGKISGTGIGFHSARSLVESSGGSVSIHETSASGTTVRLKLKKKTVVHPEPTLFAQ